uniref:GpcrRhopsn4 domain-containing protein n=1 Tax=Rhabditophanes sp. KR3021 TaxID=114890 RepID=A0AC35TMU8_9BILA
MYDTIEHIPLIFSVANEASLELNRENAIESIFKFTENSNFSKLEIMANVFTLNGTYIGLHNIDELDIQLCPGLGQKLNKFKTFGSQYSHSCQLNLIDIKKMSANLFYELYLKYQKDDGTQSLYPIYLVNQGIYSNNQFINQNEERQQSWILTKRMYVLDTTVSHQINSTISLRYLSSFKLHITFQPGEGGKILPPYAVIKHSEVGILDETTILQHSFVVSYSNDDFVNEKGLEIAFAFFFCLTVLYSVVQAYSWGKRSGKSVAEISTMIQFIFIECNILSNVILAIVAAVAIGLTISYKKQQSIVFMLTLDDNNINLKRYIIFAFVLKTIALMHRLGQLVLAETFFIDWEKNKVQTSMAINEHILSEPRPMASHEPLNNLNKSKSDSKTVGIWRTYFVANEWNELQCYRKTNIGIQVFLVVILFEYFQFKNYAKIEPQFDRKSDTLDYIYESNLTRFAILTVIYFVVNLCQWITRSFILEPIEDPFRNFVDLCSIANISIITLTHALHGYYIHGRSPHGYADTNMGEINKFLQMEKNNQSGYRGIDGQNDLQTYIFTFPNTFRDKWNRVMNTLREVTVAQSKSRNNNAVTTKIDNNVKIYEDLNNFLKTVISHGDFGCDYEITTPKVFEDFLDVELADTTLKGLLYKDESEVAYTQVFVYGNEFILYSG